MLKTIDLFAGAGGLSYGFESTGEFLIVAAAENNKNARKTYIENHKGRNDIRLIPDVRDYDFLALASEFDGIDVVIGGPPCQGFSNANRQKNHIISMNNSLVKEYFRAVKEIRPKAFIMENVSMLSSETHRFYDSAKDHDVVTSLGVQMREDELVLADSDYNGYSLMNIIQADAVADYKISDELFQLLNVLYKNRNSEERLSKYIKNKSKLIIDKIASQAEEVKNNLGILNWIVDMINTEQISACFTELGQFIKFQKTFRLKKELDSNEIIYEIENDLQTGKIIARVKSYSVIEYVNKILGDDYKKNSGVINSLWFGVPQERRRFIMIGVRSDIIQEKEIEMPEGNGAEIVTVGQAIGDLRYYEVDEEDNEPEKLPYDSSTELRLWAYMAHKQHWDYMHTRWGIDLPDDENEAKENETKKSSTDKAIDRIGTRYFFKASKGKAFVRQGIARLYWSVYLTYDENNENGNPYEYTEYFFSKQDIFTSITERSYARNKVLVLAALKELKKNSELSRTEVRIFLAKLNQAGAITVLDFLDKTQAEKLCENVMAEIKSIAVLEEGSHFRAVNDVTGKPFGPEMVIKNGQVTAVGKTISTKPKNLLGKKEGTKFVISGKQYVIKDIK